MINESKWCRLIFVLVIVIFLGIVYRYILKFDLVLVVWFENWFGFIFYIILGLILNMVKIKMFGFNFSLIFFWDMYLKIYLCMLKFYKI